MSFYQQYSEPKNGRFYKVIGVGRISTELQDGLSLGDQEAYYRLCLDRKLGVGNYELTVIASRGSGQILDREEFLELCAMVESGEYDIVIAEDLGRISRRIHAIIFCEEAEDVGTRVIAINDHVDTAKEDWKQASILNYVRKLWPTQNSFRFPSSHNLFDRNRRLCFPHKFLQLLFLVQAVVVCRMPIFGDFPVRSPRANRIRCNIKYCSCFFYTDETSIFHHGLFSLPIRSDRIQTLPKDSDDFNCSISKRMRGGH